MTPDDPRHGTVAGYIAHRRAQVPRCEPCLLAWRRYDKRRKMNGPETVSTLGSQRRIQALHCLGWSRRDIALACGYLDGPALKAVMARTTMTKATAAKIADAYERMCMTLGDGPKAEWWRHQAAARGWLPPLAWDDIDDPNHQPVRRVRTDRGAADPVVVERIIGGQILPANLAERRAVIERWLAAGRSLNDLERRTGWNVWRDRRSDVA